MSADTRLIGTKPIYYPTNAGLTIKNLGAATIYYGGPTVTTSSYTGSLSAGSSVTLTSSYYYVSTAQTLMQLTYYETPPVTGNKGVVVHGDVASTVRPTGWTSIEWIGSVSPTNATDNDTWVDTSA